MIYLGATILLLYILKTYIVYKLRYKRDRINLTTPTGKLECRNINKTIDVLTGAWIFSFLKKK